MNTAMQNMWRSVHRTIWRRVTLIIRLWKRIPMLVRPPAYQSAFLLIPVFAVMGIGGCPKQPVKAKFVQTGVTRPPAMPVLRIDTTPPAVSPVEIPDFAPQFFAASEYPPRPPAPRRAISNTEPEPEPVKPEAPQISPQLSPEEKSRAQSVTEADLKAAQQDLDTASHHSLNATQQDMADKIRSFVAQARDAIGVADWLRAKNLAQKAHVLSAELIRSF
jgi:hypothetical protein